MAYVTLYSRMPRTKSADKAEPSAEPRHSGSVNFTMAVWDLLRRIAAQRAMSGGGRMSVSEVVNALVEESRPKLERELKGTK